MADIHDHNTDAKTKLNTGYSANNPEPIEMREESAKNKQEDALHSDLEYINGQVR